VFFCIVQIAVVVSVLVLYCWHADICSYFVWHSEPVIPGFVDDYTFMVRACLDVYESLHDERWLEWAVTLQDIQDALFWDEKNSAYFTTTSVDASIVLRLKEGLFLLVVSSLISCCLHEYVFMIHCRVVLSVVFCYCQNAFFVTHV